MTAPVESRNLPIGVPLALYPYPDPTYFMEIWRAPDSSGSPDTSNDEIVAVLPVGRAVFVDYVSGSGPYWYRMRHIRPKATSSNYTEWIEAVPIRIPSVLPPPPPLGLFRDVSGTFGCPATTAETDLITLTVPRGAVAPNGTLQCRLQVQFAFNNGTKTVRVYLGPTATNIVEFTATAAQDGRAYIDFTITNVASTSLQRISGSLIEELFGGGATSDVIGSTATEDLSDAWDLLITGQHAHASDDVIFENAQLVAE